MSVGGTWRNMKGASFHFLKLHLIDTFLLTFMKCCQLPKCEHLPNLDTFLRGRLRAPISGPVVCAICYVGSPIHFRGNRFGRQFHRQSNSFFFFNQLSSFGDSGGRNAFPLRRAISFIVRCSGWRMCRFVGNTNETFTSFNLAMQSSKYKGVESPIM